MAPSEPPFRLEGRRIWVAGHRGMVGSAVMRRLAREDCELVTVDRDQVDLRHQAEVQEFDDCADALVFLLRHCANTINVGIGRDVTIAQRASIVAV